MEQIRYKNSSLWVWTLLSILVLRIVYLYLVPLQLVPDEAYYWDWSRHLDIGYFSKPPMVAWLIYISTSFLGNSEFGVRIFASLLGTLSLGMVFLLAREMFGEKIAWWSALLCLLTPGNAALSTIMTIDPPLVFFGCSFLFFLWRAAEDKNEWINFSLMGVCMALGILSKQIMLIFFFLVPFFFLLDKKLRKKICSFPFLIYIFISLVGLLLPLYWNFRHNWVTFQETAHHFAGNRFSLPIIAKTFFEYVGTQFFVITPVIAVLFYWIVTRSLLETKRWDRRIKFLFLFGPLPLMVFFLMSLRQKINANWPALFYPPAIIFMVGWVWEKEKGTIQIRLKEYLAKGVYVGIFFVVLTYLSPFIFSVPFLKGTRIDPLRRARGWREMARQVERVYYEEKRGHPHLFILASRRQVASELAFYLSFHPQVYKWDRTPHQIKDQYEIWGGPSQVGKDVSMLIIFRKGISIAPLMPFFCSIQEIGEIKRVLGRDVFKSYDIFLGNGFKGWGVFKTF